MTQRPIVASLAIAGYAVSMIAFGAMPTTANAQTALSGCDPATGLGINGQPCVELTPLDPNRISNVSFDADGSSRFRPLDTSTLGQTYECRELNSAGQGLGGGTLLIEDCGTPLTSAELGELMPFYGTTAPPAPAPTPAPPPPPQVVYTPPPPPAPVPVAPVVPPPLPPIPPVAAPVAIASSGLGNAGLIAAGIGAAAVIGIAAIALSDDDDDNNVSATTTTN